MLDERAGTSDPLGPFTGSGSPSRRLDDMGGGGKLPLARPLPFLASAFGLGDSSSSLPLRRSLSPEDARSAIVGPHFGITKGNFQEICEGTGAFWRHVFG